MKILYGTNECPISLYIWDPCLWASKFSIWYNMYMLSGCELIDAENISLLSQNMKFISLSILTCINFLECSRVVFSICLNSNLNFSPQQPIGYLPWRVSEANESQTSYSVEQANIFKYQSYSNSDDMFIILKSNINTDI